MSLVGFTIKSQFLFIVTPRSFSKDSSLDCPYSLLSYGLLNLPLQLRFLHLEYRLKIFLSFIEKSQRSVDRHHKNRGLVSAIECVAHLSLECDICITCRGIDRTPICLPLRPLISLVRIFTKNTR